MKTNLTSLLSLLPSVQNPRSSRRTRRRLNLERLEERTVLSSMAVSFGGAGDEWLKPGDTDLLGNSYLTGRFNSQPADFDPGPGVANLSSAGGDDAFVAKYGSDGSLAWARSFGSPQSDLGSATSFASEVTGEYVYVTGSLGTPADFGPGIGLLESGMFLLKLDALSGANVWGIHLGGPGTASVSDLTTADGKIYVSGGFSGSVDFDPGTGTSILDSANGSTFVWTLDQDGNFGSAWQLGSSAASIVAEAGSVYLRGSFTGTADFDPGPGVQSRTSVGNNNLWLGRYSETGTFGWVQTMQATLITSGPMAHDATALYVASTDTSQSTTSDILVVRLSKADGGIEWSQRFGTSTGYEYATTCVINPDTGALYVGGRFETPGLDFNPGGPGGEVYNAGSGDGFVLKLRADTGGYQQVWHIGGPGNDDFARVHAANGTKVYVSSSFSSTASFPTGGTLTSSGGVDGYLLVLDETDAVPPSPPPTKFYVADDGSTNRTFEYAANGTAIENYAINSGNSTPRGAASTAAGDKVWVVDANKNVYVYNTSGGLLGSWGAGSLPSNADVQGITTNGTDVWIVDAQGDKVYRYTGAASRTSGSQNAASNFSLNSGNRDATDLVTDGASIWVLNNTSSSDKVFKYTVSGSLLGSWTITSGGGNPTGITIDPSSVSNIWIVDSSTDRVYQFDAAASRTSGSQSPSTSFALAAGNTNPQGIADPPPSANARAHASASRYAIAADTAILELSAEIETLLALGRKRK